MSLRCTSNPREPATCTQKHRHRFVVAGLLIGCLLTSGCLFMPNRGTPVFVDVSTGDYWSGEGLLLEVSEDQTQCKVAVRDRALIVQTLWVPCKAVHNRRSSKARPA